MVEKIKKTLSLLSSAVRHRPSHGCPIQFPPKAQVCITMGLCLLLFARSVVADDEFFVLVTFKNVRCPYSEQECCLGCSSINGCYLVYNLKEDNYAERVYGGGCLNNCYSPPLFAGGLKITVAKSKGFPFGDNEIWYGVGASSHYGDGRAHYFSGCAVASGMKATINNTKTAQCWAYEAAWNAGYGGTADVIQYSKKGDVPLEYWPEEWNPKRNFKAFASFNSKNTVCLQRFVEGWLYEPAAFDPCECGDFNGDGIVDLTDFALLARDWLGEINDVDFLVFEEAYLRQ